MKLRLLIISIVLLLSADVKSQFYQDCTDPFFICDLKTFHFDKMYGAGEYQDVLPELKCISNHHFKETNSKWLFFEVKRAGTLIFNIEGQEDGDDLDFVLFAMNEGCTNLEEVRCMASGKDLINKRNTRSACMGSTGLRYESLDDFERSGCKYSDDNYLKFLAVEEEEKYVLLVNNYDSGNGFSINLDGDCELKESANCHFADQELNILRLFPNPAIDNIKVEFNSIAREYQIQILTSDGKIFYQGQGVCKRGMSTVDLDVDDLVSGMYILRISQGDFRASKTFVKHN